MLRIEELQQIMPLSGQRATRFLNPLNSAMSEFSITSRERMAGFLAQLAHESGQLRYVRELWGPTPAQRGYEGRKDLGNIHAGDGVRYLGRGLIQVTGRANYDTCGKALGADLLSNPELLETPELACRSAAWFWSTRGLNALADAGEWEKISRRINGGANGLAERLAFTRKALEIFT
ncbi:MAG TPA: glycoside hydrolase family 19 protein [Ramlibacter sp.]|nr:glycoside hydrolase family 19 protein [Ramlibacter sp.]